MTEIISTGCPHNCGAKCILKVHVQDGKLVKITTVPDLELKACMRGLSYLERVNSPERLKYPLQLVTPHFRYRIHSIHYNTKSLRKLYTHEVWINIKDANERGIKNGDTVRVFSDMGTIIIKAKVTERIMPGVVTVYEGAHYDPDENGIDRGGCANVLTQDKPSPAGAFPFNSSRVQIQK